MNNKEKKPEKKIDIVERVKRFWRKNGQNNIIAAKHTEFMVEPKILIGDQLNPQVLKLLVTHYLAQVATRQDSGVGNIQVTPDKLVIKNDKGEPLVIVRDKKVIEQYLAAKPAA
jgi:hypothetical protein